MSCVIQVRKDDHFIFISDSRSSTDQYCYTVCNGVDDKMVRYYQDPSVLISHVGSARDMSIIKQIPHLFDSFDKDHPVFDYRYVKDILAPMVRKQYLALSIYESDETHKFPTALNVAKGDKCFSITDRGAVYEISEYDCNGSGSEPAHGCFAVCKDKDPLVRGLKAIKAAIKYNVYCGYPVIIASTNNDKTYVLSEDEVNDVIQGKKVITL